MSVSPRLPLTFDSTRPFLPAGGFNGRNSALSGQSPRKGTCKPPDFAKLMQRPGRRGFVNQVNAKARKPEQSRTIPATATARKLLEANSSRMVHRLSRAPAQMEGLSSCTVKEFSLLALNFDPD